MPDITNHLLHQSSGVAGNFITIDVPSGATLLDG